MTVSATDDADLQKLLVELDAIQSNNDGEKNADHGALLINLMSSNFLTQMYLQLTSDEISEISTKGLKMTTEEIGQKTSDLKIPSRIWLFKNIKTHLVGGLLRLFQK